jgi:hypothetical protein
LFSAALPGPAWLVVASISAMLTLGTRLRRCMAVRQFGWLLAGFALASISTQRWLALCVPATEGRVLLEGVIPGVPARDGAELRFDVDALLVDGQVKDAPGTRKYVTRVWCGVTLP